MGIGKVLILPPRDANIPALFGSQTSPKHTGSTRSLHDPQPEAAQPKSQNTDVQLQDKVRSG